MIIGNWKMHKTPMEAKAFIEELISHDVEAYLAVPYPSLLLAADCAKNSKISIGAQNLSEHASGAYTGEVSGSMIRSCGARFVLVGHSERRFIYGETDEVVNAKVKRALAEELTPVLCVGESDAQRHAGKTVDVIRSQVEKGMEDLDPKHLVIAYEPVWAIGTGHTATPEMAQEVHALIRGLVGSSTPILYGGSVKGSNAKELLLQPDIDGALVGGASLKVNDFLSIIQGS